MNESIDLQGSTATERGQWIRNLLDTGTYEITFTKVDGSKRIMPCTLKTDLLPQRELTESRRTKAANPEVLSVWCLDKSEWRSFRVMNVTEIRPIL